MSLKLDSLPLILVSGQARSGTTILTRAIATHPQILSNGRENVWLRDLMEVVVTTLNQTHQVRELSVSPEDFLAAFRQTALQMLFPESLVGETNSVRALSTFTSLRHEMFEALPIFLPNFSLVNIVRNGIEVVASRRKHAHIAGAGDFETHCIAWSHATDIVDWFADRDRELRERFFLVRHEQLLDHDQCREVFGRIQHRFGLDRTDVCAEFVSENFVSRNAESPDSPLSEDGSAARAGVWENWTDDERSIFERVCGPSMQKLNYSIPWNQGFENVDV